MTHTHPFGELYDRRRWLRHDGATDGASAARRWLRCDRTRRSSCARVWRLPGPYGDGPGKLLRERTLSFPLFAISAKQILYVLANRLFLGPGPSLVVSSMSPRYLPQLRAALPEHVRMMDAPMSGAPHAARAGTLNLLGGDEETVDWLMPLYECMGIGFGSVVWAQLTAKVLNAMSRCRRRAPVICSNWR